MIVSKWFLEVLLVSGVIWPISGPAFFSHQCPHTSPTRYNETSLAVINRAMAAYMLASGTWTNCPVAEKSGY